MSAEIAGTGDPAGSGARAVAGAGGLAGVGAARAEGADGAAGWVVRDAALADADALALAHVRSWQAAYVGMIDQDYLDGLDEAARAEQWRGWFADGARGDVLALERSGDVVGFAGYGAALVEGEAMADATGCGELYSLNLRPDAWGRGGGTALMRTVEERLRGRGFGEAVLWVVPQNVRARRFYEHLGWRCEEIVRSDVVNGAPVDEVRYRRTLPA